MPKGWGTLMRSSKDPKDDAGGRRGEFARILPLFGALLVFLPLIWPKGAGGVTTSGAGIYLFAVWCVMILGAALLALWMRGAGR